MPFRAPCFLRQQRSGSEEPRAMLLDYLEQVYEMERRGDAREESFYLYLRDLLRCYARYRGREIDVTVIPRKTKDCLLDLQVRGENQRILGYVEAKLPGTNLDTAEKSEQVERYLQTFPNLILTNFYELRLFRHGK